MFTKINKQDILLPPKGGREGVCVVLLLWVCMGCKSHRDTIVETRIERDTVYQASVKYDSVYLERMVDVDRTRDTILIREKETKTKYRLIHDSIYITRVDSIPYTIEVEKREEIPKSTVVRLACLLLLAAGGYLVFRGR